MRNGRNIAGTILGTAAVAVILVCLCVSAGISKAKRAKTLCSGTEVEIADSAENRFVSEADILEYMEKDYGKTEGIPIEDIDLKKMEDILDSQSAVLKSEAYCTKDGILHVKITQRIPVMRFQKNGRQFQSREKPQAPGTFLVPGACGLVVSLGLEPRTSCM